MSISMESFAATGQFETFDAYATHNAAPSVFQLQCRCCGFEPETTVRLPGPCPKCRADAWERFARPGSILVNADRD
jgi:hypothetical protein